MSPEARGPAAGGDRGGFASFFEANNHTLLSYILRKGVLHADAEHVNQDTWLSLLSYWDKHGAPESEEHARRLMYMTANLRIADYWRAAGSQPQQVSFDPELHDKPSGWNSAERSDWLMEYLSNQDTQRTLTHRQETALRLVYLEERSQQEAAALMNITLNALEKLLIRARETIRQAHQAPKTRTEEGTR